MASLRLSAPNRRPLEIEEIVQRLEREFDIVEVSESEGEEYVSQLIESTELMPDETPGKLGRINYLNEVREGAVYVRFGDNEELMADCCLMPGDPDIFFDGRRYIDGPERAVVERAGKVLGYKLAEV